MMRTLTIYLTAAGLALGVTTPSLAGPITINDDYVGAAAHGRGDVIGFPKNFDIFSMRVNQIDSLLTVAIHTNFAGKSGSLFRNSTLSRTGIGYGDLFLSSSWAPHGSAADNYITDDHSNGTVWSYGFALDNRFGNTAGGGTLFSLNSADNSVNALLSEDFLTRGIFRNGQEVAVNTAGNVTEVLNDNKSLWSIDGANDTVRFEIDLTGTTLSLENGIALHWGLTCGNDTIEGFAQGPITTTQTVPEPGSLSLLGLGLAVVGLARRRQMHA